MEKLSATNSPGGVSGGKELNGGKGKKSKAKWTQAGIMTVGGRFVLWSSQMTNERLRRTQIKLRLRAADSQSLGFELSDASEAWRQSGPAQVSFCGSSDRAGRAGSARLTTQKTSTVTGSPQILTHTNGLHNTGPVKRAAVQCLWLKIIIKNERRQRWRNLTCQVKQLTEMYCRFINNQTSSSITQCKDGKKQLCNDCKTAAGISVEWQHFNWSWILSCVWLTWRMCVCVCVLMQPLCFAKSWVCWQSRCTQQGKA